MHILVCDDDAVFAAQMDEYISEWFRAREIQVQSTVCTSGEQLLATPELGRYQLAFLDVDLKTTDGIALGRYSNPRLTTIRQNSARLAQRGAEILLNCIENESGAVHEVVPFELIEDESVAALPNH